MLNAKDTLKKLIKIKERSKEAVEIVVPTPTEQIKAREKYVISPQLNRQEKISENCWNRGNSE